MVTFFVDVRFFIGLHCIVKVIVINDDQSTIGIIIKSFNRLLYVIVGFGNISFCLLNPFYVFDPTCSLNWFHIALLSLYTIKVIAWGFINSRLSKGVISL